MFKNGAVVAATLLLAMGCAGTYKQKVEYNTLEPLRVAVLPFAEVDSTGAFLDSDPNLLIDKVAVVSQELSEKPRSLVRKLVQAELEETALDILAPSLINSKLHHTEYSDSNLDFILPKIHATSAQSFCPAVFDCDAVLYGKVTRWDRSYYGIQSSTTVGLELKLISARDGRVLFEGRAEDSDSRGITKVPTGFSDLVLEPIKGLDNEITVKLAQRVVSKLLEPLKASAKPEYHATVPPSIYAAAHTGAINQSMRERGLSVMLVGSRKRAATFSIGQVITNVPMAERAPGQYSGEFVPLPTDHFDDELVVVSLVDEFGRATTQSLPGAVSLR